MSSNLIDCVNAQVIESMVDSAGNISENTSGNFTVSVTPGIPNTYTINYTSLFDDKPIVLTSSDFISSIVSNTYRQTVITGGSFISFQAKGCNDITGVYTIKRFASNTIIKLNPVNGAVSSFLIYKLLINNINTPSYGQALTADPTDPNTLYAVVSLSSASPAPISTYRLIKINISAKTATVISTLSDRFSSLTCSPAGQLYGIIGQDANNSINVGDIHAINKLTGATTYLNSLSQGVLPSAYQVIGYHNNNGLIYHLYGNSPNMTLEYWDPSAPLTPPTFVSNVGSLAQWTGLGFYGDNDFVGLIVGTGMDTVDINGSYANVGAYIGATTFGLAITRLTV